MTNYDAEDDFESYLCFAAVLAGRLKTATEALDELSEQDSPEYVRAVVEKVMKPLCALMEYKIRTYPYTSANLPAIKEICGDRAREFIISQKELFEEYYTLLPVITSKEEAETTWQSIEHAFEDVLTQI
ncbi:MAG TPA: hypothetical protein O0X27_00690 [Methanocorpusculum sp.]|nr:hypothetical protein [Methanocorpusculum sp.]